MSAVKMHVKKGDQVMIIAGKDKGKTGKISRTLPEKGAVTVEGLNIVKRHSRANKQKNTGGGIVEKEAPLSASNVMILCKSCNQTARLGHRVLDDGNKVRFCKKCKEPLEG